MSAILEVSSLSRSFGGLKAVRDVSFVVRKGEIVALIGPNGAGKSTTFNMVSGTLAPSAGKIIFDGRSIVGIAPHRVVRLGLVRTFQATVIFGRATVEENVRRGAFVRSHSRFWRALVPRGGGGSAEPRKVAQLLELLSLEPYRDRIAGSLPYGYQRRLGIAIALASEPQLLLLDEPAAGLNDEEAAGLGRLIRRIAEERGTTVLLVEHHMRMVMGLCGRIIVLDQGRLIAQGSPQEISADPAVIEAYLGAAEPAGHA